MKKILALMLCVVMLLSVVACANTNADPSGTGSAGISTKPNQDKPVNKDDLPVLTVYPHAARSAGVDTGYRSDIYAANGFQVNIWANSAEKTNAILTSGNLPDIMYVNVGEDLNTLIETGKVLKLDDYLEQLPHLYESTHMEEAMEYIRSTCSAGTGEVYGLPSGVGLFPRAVDPINPVAGNVLKLKWDAYEKIGTPEIKDYWELLDVMEDMLEAMPTHPDGTKMYGTFLNSGFDSSYWGCMTYWFAQQGYMYNNLKFLLEVNMETSELTSILEDNSMYYQGLKWYNEAMRRGLIDPDSINTDRTVQATKIDNGYAMVPLGSLPGYPDGGYYPYYIDDTVIYYPAESYMAGTVIVINAQTEHLEECLAYLDMMCDPDQIFQLQNGPEGDIWEYDGDAIVLTERYQQWINDGNSINGYMMSDGAEWSATLSLPYVPLDGEKTSYKDKNGNNVSISLNLDETYQALMSQQTYKDWQETTGYENPKAQMDDVEKYYTLPDYDQFKGYLSTAPEDELMVLLQSALKEVVCTASWKMVYAETEAEFEALWDKMVSDCIATGANDLIEWRLNDVEEAKEEWENNK